MGDLSAVLNPMNLSLTNFTFLTMTSTNRLLNPLNLKVDILYTYPVTLGDRKSCVSKNMIDACLGPVLLFIYDKMFGMLSLQQNITLAIIFNLVIMHSTK